MIWGLLLGCRQPRPPNILVVVVDELGVDKVGAYGFPGAPSTPTIDALAANGVRFENAYVTPVCSVTRAAVLTGRLPRRTGFGSNIRTGTGLGFDPSWPSLADVAHAAPEPYAAEAIGKWHLTDHGRPDSFDHALQMGFEHHHGTVRGLEHTQDGRTGSYWRWERVVDGVPSMVDGYATDVLIEDAATRIDTMEAPWLLWVGLHAAHQPLHRPPEHLLPSDPPTNTGPERFNAMVESVDTALLTLLDGMDRQTRANTIVVLLGDNGTPAEGLGPGRDPARHKGTVYEAGVRVPFIVSGPGIEASVSSALVHGVDLFPTVAEWVGADLSQELLRGGIDGRSLAPVLRGARDPSPREYVWTERFEGTDAWQTIRDARYKLMRVPGAPDQVFDLSTQAFDEGQAVEEPVVQERLVWALEERAGSP